MYSPVLLSMGSNLPSPGGEELVTAWSWLCSWPCGPHQDQAEMIRLAIWLEASMGSNWTAVVGAGTKAPDIFCSVFSLTFGLGEEGPVLQQRATVGLHICRASLLTQSVPGSMPLLRKEVLYTYRRVSLCRRTLGRQVQERCCGWGSRLWEELRIF